MSELIQIDIDLGRRSYPVFIGHDYLMNTADLIKPYIRSEKVFLITDEIVGLLYLPLVRNSLESAGMKVSVLTVPAGESSKSFAQAEKILEKILKTGCDRHSVIISLGGGVVGDLAGFCASVLLRGIDFIQIPTTLLSQTDSSVGGKTGINTLAGKNLVGTFHQPKAVLVDVYTLKTLDHQQVLAGYAEVAKYGLIQDKSFWEWLENNAEKIISMDEEACLYAVEQSCRIKAGVVMNDEFEEKGLRALLNFGHTFGHAFEAASGMNGAILHGEAVAAGSVMAARLSEKLKLCPAGISGRIREHYKKMGLPTSFHSFKTSELLSWMKKDKKTLSDKLNLVLLKDIGRAVVMKSVPVKEIEEVLEERD